MGAAIDYGKTKEEQDKYFHNPIITVNLQTRQVTGRGIDAVWESRLDHEDNHEPGGVREVKVRANKGRRLA